MKKQTYMKPIMEVVKTEQVSIICASGNPQGAQTIKGNVFDQETITGGSGPARAKERGSWEEVESTDGWE